ncbi:MAG: 4Fe-4S binding protein [Candidatus Geothermincolia bacterium]
MLATILESKVDAWGCAPVDRFAKAPERHHPCNVLPGARSVIVTARKVPRGCFDSPEFEAHFLHRSYHTVYPYLDQLGFDIALELEKAGEKAVQVPSFAPLAREADGSWGIISLKHAAQAAGLGSFGHCGLLYHPEHGAMLRFGAVITTAELDAGPILEYEPCEESCRACEDACPADAFVDGEFVKGKCQAYSIRHPIYPLVLKEEWGMANLELVINTAGYNYWVGCAECLKACPAN